MKSILLAGGTDGDVHPLLGIGRALAARGHEVLFYTTPHYFDLARRCGVQPFGLLAEGEFERLIENSIGMNPLRKLRYVHDLAVAKLRQWCGQLAGQLDRDTVLIAPPGLSVVTRLLQEKYGTPCLTTVFGPAYLFSTERPPLQPGLRLYGRLPYPLRKSMFRAIEYLLTRRMLPSLLKEPAAGIGLSLPPRIPSGWLYSPQRVLGLFAEWFCPRPGDWPGQLALIGFPLFNEATEPKPLDPQLQAFLDAGPPPVVFTAGSRARNCRAFFESARQALERLGMRGIFLTRAADQLPPALPAGILHQAYQPLDQLLPRAGALVHHGGIGTVAQALSAGTPQLLTPHHSDQFHNAAMVERLGCGLALNRTVRSDPLARRLQQLLEQPTIRQNCLRVRRQMEPGELVCRRAAEQAEAALYAARRYAGRSSAAA